MASSTSSTYFRRAALLVVVLLLILTSLVVVRHYSLATKFRSLVSQYFPTAELTPDGQVPEVVYEQRVKKIDNKADSLMAILHAVRIREAAYRDTARREHVKARQAFQSVQILRDSTRVLAVRVTTLRLKDAQKYLASRLPNGDGSPVSVVVDKDTLTALNRPHLDSVNRTFVRYDQARKEIDTLHQAYKRQERVITQQDLALAQDSVAIGTCEAIGKAKDEKNVLTEEELNRTRKIVKTQKKKLTIGGILLAVVTVLAIL